MHIWTKIPFLRLLVPFITGIVVEWYLKLPVYLVQACFILATAASLGSFFVSMHNLRVWAAAFGFMLNGLLVAAGALATSRSDIRHSAIWFGHNYKEKTALLATLLEDPVPKTNSYKVIARIIASRPSDRFINSSGKIILYFENKSFAQSLCFGSVIIFSKHAKEIRNSGNPGAFDYKRYCLFADITHQVFLKQSEFILPFKTSPSPLDRLLRLVESNMLRILRTNITSAKEFGLAEALLIGYKGDLDKELVKSYTNTGIVHIIAISGMHIALVYWLLEIICRPLKKINSAKWVTALLIISGLWLFSLLAGAQPSVLRSAVMFTCIVAGQNFKRRANTYNSLAASAFVLLLINPFWLWDVGFQLSYVAVLSILIFAQPLYRCLFIKNRILDFVWKLNSVTIAAQLLTTPISIYHFHQFPNLFLLTNLVAVPCSSIIVLGEIFLCCISFFPFLATQVGKIISSLIWLMNSFTERIEALPFAVWRGIEISVLQCLLLMFVVTSLGIWLLAKRKKGLLVALLSTLIFAILRFFSFYQCNNQQRVVVFNIPKRSALGFISGRNQLLFCDTVLSRDRSTEQFHVKPAELLYRTGSSMKFPIVAPPHYMIFGSKKILWLNDPAGLKCVSETDSMDILIVSGRAQIQFAVMSKIYKIGVVVFDSSVPAFKMKTWIRECETLHLTFWNVTSEGAFVINVN